MSFICYIKRDYDILYAERITKMHQVGAVISGVMRKKPKSVWLI